MDTLPRAAGEAKPSDQMRELFKTTSGEVCVYMCVCFHSERHCALGRLCGFSAAAVDTDVFVYLQAPEAVLSDAFANYRITLLKRSPSASRCWGAVGVELILYLLQCESAGATELKDGFHCFHLKV